jgi:hypothetical protein
VNPVLSWLDEREPAPPLALTEWLTVPDRGLPLIDTLIESGNEALAEAERRPGRDRHAAFYLLAADALFTYACEAAADDEDVEEKLRAMLERPRNS